MGCAEVGAGWQGEGPGAASRPPTAAARGRPLRPVGGALAAPNNASSSQQTGEPLTGHAGEDGVHVLKDEAGDDDPQAGLGQRPLGLGVGPRAAPQHAAVPAQAPQEAWRIRRRVGEEQEHGMRLPGRRAPIHACVKLSSLAAAGQRERRRASGSGGSSSCRPLRTLGRHLGRSQLLAAQEEAVRLAAARAAKAPLPAEHILDPQVRHVQLLVASQAAELWRQSREASERLKAQARGAPAIECRCTECGALHIAVLVSSCRLQQPPPAQRAAQGRRSGEVIVRALHSSPSASGLLSNAYPSPSHTGLSHQLSAHSTLALAPPARASRSPPASGGSLRRMQPPRILVQPHVPLIPPLQRLKLCRRQLRSGAGQAGASAVLVPARLPPAKQRCCCGHAGSWRLHDEHRRKEVQAGLCHAQVGCGQRARAPGIQRRPPQQLARHPIVGRLLQPLEQGGVGGGAVRVALGCSGRPRGASRRGSSAVTLGHCMHSGCCTRGDPAIKHQPAPGEEGMRSSMRRHQR